MDYFSENYKNKQYTVVGLKGERTNKKYLYPWDL